MNEHDAKKLMQIEKECINRDCDRNCAKCDIVQDINELNSAYDVVIKALEKQIAKKPDTKTVNKGIDISGEYNVDSDYICPSCTAVVGDYETEDHFYDYCPNCGQKLDWSGEDDGTAKES